MVYILLTRVYGALLSDSPFLARSHAPAGLSLIGSIFCLSAQILLKGALTHASPQSLLFSLGLRVGRQTAVRSFCLCWFDLGGGAYNPLILKAIKPFSCVYIGFF